MEKTMKRLLSFVIVAVMVFGMIVPATPLHAHAAEEATDQVAAGKAVAEAAAQIQFPAAGENLDAENKYFIADCPACGAKNASWLARGEGSGHTNNLIEAATGNHYYLVGDVTQIQKYSAGTTCVHLNGHNVTNATANAIVFQGKGEGSELNIMGSGVITGGRSDGNPVVANIYGTAPVLNLYGGTVKKMDIRYPMFNLGAADRTLNVYAGATLDGTGTINSTNSAGVYVNGGNLNVYGGKVINGLGTNGNDVYAKAGTVNIEGAAVIGQLYANGATVTFGTLNDGASIGYKQNAAGKVADGKGAYAGKYIHAYVDGASMVNARNGNLTYCAPTVGVTTSGDTAYCAACDADVAWISFTAYHNFNSDTGRMHLYLGRAYTDTDALQFTANASGCLHLNGQTLTRTTTNPAAVSAAGVNVYIMGKGAIVGSRDAGNSILNLYSASATVNVYGGALKVASGSTLTGQAIYLDNEILNLGDGASIDLSGTSARAVRLTAATAQLNILGGKIICDSSANAVIEHRAGTVNFEAGLVQASNSQYPVYVDHDGTSVGTGVFNMNGGKIVSNTAKENGDIYFNGEGTLNISTGTFSINPSGRAQNGIAAERVRANEDGTFTVMCAEHDACFDIPCAICGFDAYAGHDFQEGTCVTCGEAQCAVEGHAMVSLEGQEATCTEAGLTDSWECSRCDYASWEQTEIPAAHKYVDGVCSVCGEAQCDAGHTPGEITIENEVAATYEATGSYDKVYTCEVCQQQIRETVVTAKLTKVTDALAFVGETNVAYCPVCETDVEWEALAADAANALTAGKHYYLNGAAGVASGAYMTMAQGTACVHLNGNDITCTGGASVLTFTGSSTVNVMGSGNVATTSNGGQTMNLGSGGTAVIYGGTYKNNGTGPVFNMQTATLQVEAGATVLGNNGIKLAHGTFGSTAIINGGNISQITLLNDNSLTLNGAPVIGSLSIPAGKTITLGALTEGASIAVDAEGAFTAAVENAEAYAAYFSAVDSDKKEVTVVEGALAITNKETYKPAPVLGYTDNLIFSETTPNSAWCAACGEEVIWTAWNGSEQLYLGSGAKGHYYMTADVENFDCSAYAYKAAVAIDTATLCLHLNGHDLSSQSKAFILGTSGSILNVLGTGTVSGADSANAATIQVPQGGTLNLYAGTYTKPETVAGGTTNIMRFNRGAKVYLGDAATVIDPLKESSVPALYADATDNKITSYVIDGAVVNGTVSCTTGQPITISGDAQLEYVVLKNGNKVTVGALTEGAQIGIGISGRDGADAVFADNAEQNAQYFVAGKPDDCHVITVDGALALGDHEPEETVITEATCTEPGLKNVSCACGYEAEGVVIEATGHTPGAVSCTEAQTCETCGEVLAEAPGHQGDTIKIKVIEATCTEAGSREIVTVCTVCDEVIFDGVEEIPALGHEFVDGKCTVCGAGQCDEGHTAGEPVKQEGTAATCTNAGFYVNVTKCVYCETIMDFQVVTENPVPHEYVDGKCTVCGADEPTAPSEPEEPAGDPVATINGEPYTTVKDAADAAVEGDTIILTADSNEPDSKITLWPGVTLDLNGNTLTAYLVNGALDAFITDGSANKTGLLAVEKVAFNEANGDMPVWTADGYRFLYAMPVIHDFKATGDSNRTNPRVRLDRDNEALQQPLIDQIKASNATTCKLRLRLRLTWNSGGDDNLQYIYYTATDLDGYANYRNGWTKTVMGKTLSGVEGMENMLYITPEIYAVDENGNTLVTVAGETKLATIG